MYVSLLNVTSPVHIYFIVIAVVVSVIIIILNYYYTNYSTCSHLGGQNGTFFHVFGLKMVILRTLL